MSCWKPEVQSVNTNKHVLWCVWCLVIDFDNAMYNVLVGMYIVYRWTKTDKYCSWLFIYCAIQFPLVSLSFNRIARVHDEQCYKEPTKSILQCALGLSTWILAFAASIYDVRAAILSTHTHTHMMHSLPFETIWICNVHSTFTTLATDGRISHELRVHRTEIRLWLPECMRPVALRGAWNATICDKCHTGNAMRPIYSDIWQKHIYCSLRSQMVKPYCLLISPINGAPNWNSVETAITWIWIDKESALCPAANEWMEANCQLFSIQWKQSSPVDNVKKAIFFAASITFYFQPGIDV